MKLRVHKISFVFHIKQFLFTFVVVLMVYLLCSCGHRVGVILVLYLLCSCGCGATFTSTNLTYTNARNNLTYVPTDIPPEAVNICLHDNQIVTHTR